MASSLIESTPSQSMTDGAARWARGGRTRQKDRWEINIPHPLANSSGKVCVGEYQMFAEGKKNTDAAREQPIIDILRARNPMSRKIISRMVLEWCK